MARPPEPLSPRLPAGFQVGAWRVEALQGHGAYGAVYRAVRVGQEHSGPVALKMALHSWDKRFGREVELLSRLSHPGVPRLLDRGLLRSGSGVEYAFFVMEWVEGTRLYAWAEQSAPSDREVCRVLARLARALEAVHAILAVHRDVKGDNVLVQLSDRSPVLLDFGSCHYPGAERLTWQSLAPFTPEYLSPQAYLFDIGLARERDGYYVPTPADDLFALGVTAYRLVMGEYPPPMRVQQDKEGAWHVSSRDPRPLLERNVRVEPVLREWILRLLSDAPEARGTAAELAQALEAVAEEEVAQRVAASRPASEVCVPALPVPVVTGEKPERPRAFLRVRDWKPWLTLAAVGVSAVLLWSVRREPLSTENVRVSAPRFVESQVPDAGTAGVGDTSPTEPESSVPPAEKGEPVTQSPPSEPRRKQPRQQLQPDEKGQCPGRKQVVIDGGCWVESPAITSEACVENGYVLRDGKCYTPVLEPYQKSVPTSGPAKGR